eukprot:gene9329-1596_t
MADVRSRFYGLKNKFWGGAQRPLSDEGSLQNGLRGEISLTVIAASNLATSSNSSPYDPYCVAYIAFTDGSRSKGYKTGVRKRTTCPHWNEYLDMPDIQDGTALELCDGEAHYMTRTLDPVGNLKFCITFMDASLLFGLPLEDVCRREGRSIPRIVTRCVKELEARGLNDLGLYRVAGNARLLRRLKEELNQDPQADCFGPESIPGVSTVASLLKMYLRELPEPIFSSRLYPAFMEVAGKQVTHSARLRFLQGTISALPKSHYDTVVYLFEHFSHVLRHSDKNKMTSPSLATCLGPSLFTPCETDTRAMEVYSVERQNAVAQYLLDNWDELRRELISPTVPPGDDIEDFSKIPSGPPKTASKKKTKRRIEVEGPLVSPSEQLSRSALSQLQDTPDSEVCSVWEFIGLDTNHDKLNRDEVSADSLSQMLHRCAMRDSMSTAKCRSIAQQRQSHRSAVQTAAHVQMGNALFGTHTEKQLEHVTAREFRELCYELGLFVDTDDVFSTVSNGQRLLSRQQFITWWRSAGAFLVSVYNDKRRRRVFTQAIAYFQFYDTEYIGQLDFSNFKLLHADLISHSYSNIHADAAVCYRQIHDIPSEMPISDQRICKFNDFVAWLIHIDALAECDELAKSSATQTVASKPMYTEV